MLWHQLEFTLGALLPNLFWDSRASGKGISCPTPCDGGFSWRRRGAPLANGGNNSLRQLVEHGMSPISNLQWRFPLSNIQCLGHVPLKNGFFPKQVNGRERVLHPHRSVWIVINSKGLWGGLTAGESGSSVPRFHIYGMLFFHIRPIAYCINNIYL